MSVRLKQLAADGATEGQLVAFNETTGLWEPRDASNDAFFSPLSTTITVDGSHVGIGVSPNGTGNVQFRVPAGFVTLVAAEILLIAGNTLAAANIDLISEYAAVGEPKTANTETDATSTYAWTADEIASLDVSGILTGIAANDIGGILIDFNGVAGGATVLGMRLRYNG